ncbi:MAG: hypothetical protein KDK91_13870 [Gammaproteobacteria bacterium]|nr:hypothetical protein [Gammaproteobacteria bacterium]
MSLPGIRLVASVFERRNAEGDFAWMIEQPEYARALFVFNDNEGQFEALLAGLAAGGGNAIIRPYQAGRPRAVGVPTGPGYDRLRPEVQAVIDRALARIGELVGCGDYDRLIYSADPSDPALLGHGIFEVGQDVRAYIVEGLRRIAAGDDDAG